MKKVLFVAVHPDDETLGCGGTILKHRENGDAIYWLIITSIENHPRQFPLDVVEKRRKTIQKVSNAYQFNGVYELQVPTTMVDSYPLGKLVQKFDNVIKEVQPNVIYSMFNNDVHSDHRVAFNALYSCTKSFRNSFIEKILMIEALSETEFALSVPSSTFIPNVYVDISEFINQKLEIMSLYDTEVMEEPYPRSLSSIKALARVRGSRAGVEYAEAFQLLYEKL